MHFSHRQPPTGANAIESDPLRVIDAALAFASARDLHGYEEVVGLVAALRDALTATNPSYTDVATDDVLLRLFAHATCDRHELVDALLDLRQATRQAELGHREDQDNGTLPRAATARHSVGVTAAAGDAPDRGPPEP